jgi:hypothetical protein
MIKALVVGVGLLIAAYGLWFATLQNEQFSEINVLILWVSPFIAAFVSAYLAPRNKLLLGISMALPTAILSVALNYLHQAQGNSVDFPGSRGAMILFMTTLLYSGILCSIGAVIGRALSNKKENTEGYDGGHQA